MPYEPGKVILCVPVDSGKTKEIKAFLGERFAEGRAKFGAMKVIASGYSDAFPGNEVSVLEVKSGKENAWVKFFEQGKAGQNRLTALPLRKKRNLLAIVRTVNRLHR